MQRKSVFIVEDEGLIARDIAGQLEKSGFGVVGITASGEDALAQLEITHPDLVLMDIRLQGGMDGIEAAHRVRAEYNLPVIFLTSHADSETLNRAKQALPFGYLVKPFRPVDLASAVETALHKHSSELKLAEREAWLSTVLDCSAIPTIVTNTHGAIQFLNTAAERLLNRESSECVGKNWMNSVVLKDANAEVISEDFVARCIDQVVSIAMPKGLSLDGKDGETILVEGEFATSIKAGKIVGSVITIRDVSQRMKEDADASHQQKMLALGRMAGGVAHDFNNLLTVILGYGDLLAIELADRPATVIRVNAVREAAQSAADITRQLLLMARKQIAPAEAIKVGPRLERLLRLLAGSLGPLIHVEFDFAKDAGSVHMNPAQFDQVFLNLALNARDAMPEGGKLAISAENCVLESGNSEQGNENNFINICVSDSGAGISREIIPHLFEPFFTTKGHGKGTGLGLAIVHSVVVEAGGEVKVRSVCGEGTTFQILLPRMEDAKASTADPEEHRPDSGPEKHIILLVEDEAAIRGLLFHYLNDRGFKVISASGGAEALEIAQAHRGTIDLLLSDVLMPNMDGVTLSAEMSAQRPGIKTLLMSGHSGNVIQRLRQTDASSAFVQKPFTLPGLLKKINETISHRAV